MKRRFRVEGIYDRRTIQLIKELSIFDFGFDFRPLSTSFLQQHIFMDLIKNNLGPSHKIYLRFENEQNFIIQKFLDDLQENGIPKDQIILEFSDDQELDYYEQFQIPYLLHFTQEKKANIKDSMFFKGLVFSSAEFQIQKENGKVGQFQNKIFNFLGSKSIDSEIFLYHDWDTDLYPSLFEYFDIDACTLPINDKIEVCYRNVDFNSFKQNFKILKTQTL